MVVTLSQKKIPLNATKIAKNALNGKTGNERRKLVNAFKEAQTKFRVENAKYQAHLKYSLNNTENAGATEIVKFGKNAPEERRVFYLLDTEGPEKGLFVMPAELGDLVNTFKEWKQGKKGAR
jgi:hypothetical protein